HIPGGAGGLGKGDGVRGAFGEQLGGVESAAAACVVQHVGDRTGQRAGEEAPLARRESQAAGATGGDELEQGFGVARRGPFGVVQGGLRLSESSEGDDLDRPVTQVYSVLNPIPVQRQDRIARAANVGERRIVESAMGRRLYLPEPVPVPVKRQNVP